MTDYLISADVAWHGTTERVAVLDLSRTDASPLILDGSAGVIWHAVAAAEGGTVATIVTEVAKHFEVDEDEVAESVQIFLDDLAARGLVTTAANPT